MDDLSPYANNRSFRYSRLPNSATYIRLMRLNRSSSYYESAPISAELVVVPVSEKPQYVALSYVWGSETPRVTIFLDGRPFGVRQNLYAFLWHYLRSGRQDWLWIDAICIDQENLLEKGSQVSMMGDIFRNAEAAILWLGPPEPKVVDAFEVLSLHHDGEYEDAFEREHALLIHALKQSSSSTYWSRLWVTQEFILAPDLFVLYGNVWMAWDQLLEACQLLHNKTISVPRLNGKEPKDFSLASLLSADMNALIQQRADRQDKTTEHVALSLLDLVAANRAKLCQNPLDRIYAVLAMTIQHGDRGGGTVLVDYAISTEELFFRMIKLLGTPDQDWVFLLEALEVTLPLSMYRQPELAVHRFIVPSTTDDRPRTTSDVLSEPTEPQRVLQFWSVEGQGAWNVFESGGPDSQRLLCSHGYTLQEVEPKSVFYLFQPFPDLGFVWKSSEKAVDPSSQPTVTQNPAKNQSLDCIAAKVHCFRAEDAFVKAEGPIYGVRNRAYTLLETYSDVDSMEDLRVLVYLIWGNSRN